MSETPEQDVQVDDAQAQVGGPDATALQNEIELLKANNRKLLSEKKNATASVEDLQRQISDLQSNQQKAKQSQLAEAGEFKTLWTEATGTVSTLQDQLSAKDREIEELKVQFQQQQIKASALNAFSQGGVHAPEHMFTLLKDSLRLKDGAVVALVGGVETPLQQHLDSLKAPGSGMDYFFSGSGARGMSSSGSSTSTAGGKSWASMSLMERIQLEEDNSALAAQLKAQG
nr:phage minor structural protein GP20 [uncultured Mediterranean phage uvMED]